ncbi:MAG: putative rRNA maturation factor YbeY [Parcubacteria bacterium C7867-006]|nr:MAG: putative rRNA maturation factor YbeY [Parcubacteria bacterium C7867-006]
MNSETFTITNKTKGALPSVPFAKIKDIAMGKGYSLSLVFIGERRSKKLNGSYRNKNKSTNVLSFTLDKKNGEIFITPAVVKKQTKKFGRNFQNLVAFLFIHGLMHLKGMDHGSTMERAEQKLRKQFGI